MDHYRKGILGVGNLLLADEGVGPQCITLLQQRSIPEDIMLFDGGTVGYGLMDVITSLDAMVLIDCVRGGGAPGTIYKFNAGDVETVHDQYSTSAHQVGICEVLSSATLIGKAPRTVIIGVEPLSLNINMELSKPVANRLNAIAQLALDTILQM